MMDKITYLRQGRTKHCAGFLRHRDPVTGCSKVLPDHAGWKSIWITDEEIAAAHLIPAHRRMIQGLRHLESLKLSQPEH